jgi:hypothetical protein
MYTLYKVSVYIYIYHGQKSSINPLYQFSISYK